MDVVVLMHVCFCVQGHTLMCVQTHNYKCTSIKVIHLQLYKIIGINSSTTLNTVMSAFENGS